jgi:hypothetical protein
MGKPGRQWFINSNLWVNTPMLRRGVRWQPRTRTQFVLWDPVMDLQRGLQI